MQFILLHYAHAVYTCILFSLHSPALCSCSVHSCNMLSLHSCIMLTQFALLRYAQCTYSFVTLSLQRLSQQLCQGMFVNEPKPSGGERRKKRSVSDPTPTPTPAPLSPRMLVVAVVGQTGVNVAPVVNNVTLTLTEDSTTGVSTTITYFDDDGDVLAFTLLQQPRHGAASVTPAGVVTYWPTENYAGDDVMLVGGREVMDAGSLAAGLTANVVNVTVFVTVVNINDPPDIFFVPGRSIDHVTVSASSCCC